MIVKKHYLVIDLEATCDDEYRIPRQETEIIEIGAVLCHGETLEPMSEFQTFVKPVRHPNLTNFCQNLTSITQEQVENAPTFPGAIRRLETWLQEQNVMGQFLFCSWGDYDKNQFARQERASGIRLPFGYEHLNLKEAFHRRSGDYKKLGTGQALRRMGFTFEGTQHRGIDDARNIAKLLPWCVGKQQIPPLV